MKDRNGYEIKMGDYVKWYDPEESARDLSRTYLIWDIRDEMVLITDEYSEAEVFPCELGKVDITDVFEMYKDLDSYEI